jgi:hypothetical protein
MIQLSLGMFHFIFIVWKIPSLDVFVTLQKGLIILAKALVTAAQQSHSSWSVLNVQCDACMNSHAVFMLCERQN